MGFLQRFPLPYVSAFYLFYPLLMLLVIGGVKLERWTEKTVLTWAVALAIGMISIQGSQVDMARTVYRPGYDPLGRLLPVVSWPLTIVICLTAMGVMYAAIRIWRLHAHPFVVALFFAAAVCSLACAELDVMYSKTVVSAVPWKTAYALLEVVAIGIIIAGVTVSLIRYCSAANRKKRKSCDTQALAQP